ncbi:hypothetical protein GO285_01253 [Ralstonia solanacearum]|nr:hypothetical protein [Ralstonia solanacearum]NKF94157.1 hypothetical protein [Ralstonia solanacearum]NKG09528.1 hypothetical protein [Ralstonia solanacearum]
MNTNRNLGILKLALSATMSAALAACGGGGDGSSTTLTSPTTTNQQLTGKAIDGYLVGATVCFDDGQGGCDATLPSTTTDGNGNYSLPAPGDVIGKKINVIVTPNTHDLSNPNGSFSSTFTLSAIVASTTQNVTPLTTLVVSQVNAGVAQDKAVAAVQNLVGGNVDPNADYIASGNTQTSAIAASMVSHLTSLGGQGPIAWSQVQATLNAIAAKGTTEVQQSDVDAQLTNPAYSTAIDTTAALASPLYTIDGDLSQWVPGNSSSSALSPVREHFQLAGSTLSITQEAQSNGAWSTATPVGGYDVGFSGSVASLNAGAGAYLMKADGSWTNWLTAAQLHPSYSLSSVGPKLVGTDPNTGDQVTVSYRTTDVSGQPLSRALQIDYRNPIRQAMTGTFPSGTTSYIATIARANDQLLLVNQGLGLPWINGRSVNQPIYDFGTARYTLGDPAQAYTSVQQAIGTQTTFGGDCWLLNIEANGVARIVESGASGCNYSQEPITFPVMGSWSAYPRNPNVIVINLPKTMGAPNVPLNNQAKNVINAGGSLVVGLLGGKLLGGFLLPASAPFSFAQFPAAITDTAAASMRAAAAKLGLPQNP